MAKKPDLRKELSIFKRKLSGRINVEKVLLFGSQVEGKAHMDSDVDLIIVSKDFSGAKFRERALGFHDYWSLDYPVDFLCYTPEEFERMGRKLTIVREAVRNGVEIK